MTSLRAFEAAARTGSYVTAALEIGVTPAAISQHVRKLEDYFGKRLFHRLHNRIILTDAGNAIFARVEIGLRTIAEATEEHLSARSRSRLVISCIESVADKWLVPQITIFSGSNADFLFELRIEADPVDFDKHNIDVRFAYDPAPYSTMEMILLSPDEVVPVCSPGYLERLPEVAMRGMPAVPADDLLHISWGQSFGSRPTWNGWRAAADLPPVDTGRGSQATSLSLGLDLAKAGLGVVLGQRIVADADLASGSLVALSDIAMSLGRPYCIAFPAAKRHKRHLQPFTVAVRDAWARCHGRPLPLRVGMA